MKHTLLSLSFALLAMAPGAVAQDFVGEIPYEKLATRAETFTAMRAKLIPDQVRWGAWWQLSAFPYGGIETDDLALPTAFEVELERMGAGGPGPDLERVWEGKAGSEASWLLLGEIHNRMVDLHRGEDPELQDYALAYLYTTVQADTERSVTLNLGTDDGVRVWLNGELLLDHDVPRGLDVMSEEVTFDFAAGTNHVLVKVSEGAGDWAFQINSRQQLSGALDTKLEYLLDRDFPPGPERAYWNVLSIPVPEDVVLEVGGLDLLADGTPVVSTRRGDVFLVDDAYAVPPTDASFHRFASGLHEALGVGTRVEGDQEVVYTVQRGELTRLVDEDGDRTADLYECASDGWGVSGNYHEFAFGPEFDDEGNAWVTLNVGFCGSLGKAVARWRGWALKVAPDGTVTPVCDGLRSPNGIELNAEGDAFYVDNQGDYVATNRLSHLKQGAWHGHPASLRWREDLPSKDARPPRQQAAVWFPYKKMGQSAADIALDDTGGAFGPFTGQFFVGDQTLASVMRVFLEKVEGEYQGACIPFIDGLDCGVNRVAFAPDGSMFVGQTDRGWGSVGRKPYGLQRIVYRGTAPFEILALRATPRGFEFEFTEPLDPACVTPDASDELGSLGALEVSSFTYEYHAAYGAPESDTRREAVTAARLSEDGRRLQVEFEELREGYVYEFHLPGIANAAGAALLHPEAYYTLQRVPGRDYAEAELPRVLFLTHSAGYAHDVVKRPRPHIYSEAEERLVTAAEGRYEVVPTQDPAALEQLVDYDAVVFYTTGELPVAPEVRDALLAWVRAGGAFVGVHSATDTFYEYPAYLEMLGGTFDGHPWNEEVRVRVEDGAHPATEDLGQGFEITDEIYQFRDYRRFPKHVLCSLDPGSVDIALGKRADADYAIAWCKPYGEGRVFYTALGHGSNVWNDARFQEHLLGGIQWALDGADLPAPVPEGATVLLGPDADPAAWGHQSGPERLAWKPVEGGDTGDTVDTGAVEVVGGTSAAVSRAEFGDALIHVEFRTPENPPEVTGQARGNSGVYVQGRYEVQVLDSYGLEPGMGDCGSIYSIKITDVNASRPPARWQYYDIEFRAPRFGAGGEKLEDARMSVWHNGVPIHRDVVVPHATGSALSAEEVPLGPLLLQDHGDPVQFRNVWVLPRS